jgi:hypothetical protein
MDIMATLPRKHAPWIQLNGWPQAVAFFEPCFEQLKSEMGRDGILKASRQVV